MKTQEKIMNVVLSVLGIVLFVYGVSTPGLFPFGLPSCFLGGFLIGRFLPNVVDMFKRKKEKI